MDSTGRPPQRYFTFGPVSGLAGINPDAFPCHEHSGQCLDNLFTVAGAASGLSIIDLDRLTELHVSLQTEEHPNDVASIPEAMVKIIANYYKKQPEGLSVL